MLQSILLRVGGVAIVVVALLSAAKYFEHVGYEKCRTEMQADSLKLAIAYADRIVKAEGERDANQTIIDRLDAESHSLRIHIPVCPSIAGATDKNGTAGLFSQRVDESFARLQARGGQLFKRCDELNLDAIRRNASRL